VAGIGTGGTITGVGEVSRSASRRFSASLSSRTLSCVVGGTKGPHPFRASVPGSCRRTQHRNLRRSDSREKRRCLSTLRGAWRVKKACLVGISSGAAVWAALEVRGVLKTTATDCRYYSLVWRAYLSTALFADLAD
jgi:cysteine synthase A